MHVKTNIELNVIHFAILAICPLMIVASNSKEALCLAVMTLCAFVLSVMFCSLFNKIFRRTTKIFVTAMISSLVVTLLNFALTKVNIMGLVASDKFYFAALSAIVLSVDIYYIDTRAVLGHIFLKFLTAVLTFFGLYMLYAMLTEILSVGTLFGNVLIKNFTGIEFFGSTTFGFILLGLICVIAEAIYQIISKNIYEKQIAYGKYVKRIRNEKIFQYDTLRRKKILATPIEVRNIAGEEADEIKEKSNENVAIVDSDEEDSKSNEETVPKKKKKRKNRKLKVSKEAKVEQVFEKQAKEGEE